MSVPSLAVFGVALHATLKTSLVVGAGAALSRFGYWRESTVSDMSAATVRVLLPCFLWSSLAADLRPEALRRAWMVPVFAAAHILVGGALGLAALAALAAWRRRARRRRGFLLASAPPSRHPFWEGVLAACAFSNASGLPLSLLPTVLQGAPQLWVGSAAGGSDAERLAKTQALAVVLVTLYAVLNKCIMWTAGRALLEGAHRRHGVRHQRAGGAAAAAALEAAGRPQPATSGLTRMLTEPVVVACALGIGTAVVPPLQRLFARYGSGGGGGGGGGAGSGGSAAATAAPLGFVIDAAAFMGKAAFPMMMLLLGATLDAGSRHHRHQHQHRHHSRRRGVPAGDAAMGKGCGDGAPLDAVGDEEQLCDSAAIAIGIVVRLCAMPAAGLWLVRVAEQRGWLLPLGGGGGGGGGGTDDGAALTRFVVLLGACMPSAMLLALMAQLHGAVQAAAMSKLLFLQYALAPISLTLSIATALHECTVPVPGSDSVSSP